MPVQTIAVVAQAVSARALTTFARWDVLAGSARAVVVVDTRVTRAPILRPDKRQRLEREGPKSVTVGLAALARGGKAIVMMADRRLTYLQDDLHTESWKEKLLPVKDTWHVMFAGNATLAQAVVGNAQKNAADIPVVPKLGQALQRLYDSEIDRTILWPRRLDRDLYLARKAELQPLAEKFRDDIDSEIANFRLDCVLLACGYDEGRSGIMTLVPFTLSHAFEGFAAIGSGARAALSAMVFSELDPENDIDVQLYQLLYAKSHAEMTSYVGYALDAWILLPDKLVKVDGDIVGHEDALLDRVLEASTKLPFGPRSEWEKPGYSKPRDYPPHWEKRLKDYCDSIAGKAR